MVVIPSDEGSIVRSKRGRRISEADFRLLNDEASKGLNLRKILTIFSQLKTVSSEMVTGPS